MPQTFTQAQVLTLKLGIAACALIAAAAIATWKNSLGYAAGLHEAVPQPVPFSHKHHVGDDGIDCRYCHAAVETAATAGMPATETCMTCHSQLFTDAPVLQPVRESYRQGKPMKWRRVYDLPDFVYFNHAIHVHKGVGCVTCHGRVDTMPFIARQVSLDMQWCVNCHRHPERYLRPREEVFNLAWTPPEGQAALGPRLVARYGIRVGRLTDCSICHR
jgi:hypothetical protein